ncbi:hypothetical protein MHYP_G00214550 [Metynnis hypsauchen]
MRRGGIPSGGDLLPKELLKPYVDSMPQSHDRITFGYCAIEATSRTERHNSLFTQQWERSASCINERSSAPGQRPQHNAARKLPPASGESPFTPVAAPVLRLPN